MSRRFSEPPARAAASPAGAIVLANGQYSVLNNANVISILNETHRKVDFSNLPSGQNLYLTIIAFNSAGAGAANAPVVFKTL